MEMKQFVFPAMVRHSVTGQWQIRLILRKEGNWWTIELNLSGVASPRTI